MKANLQADLKEAIEHPKRHFKPRWNMPMGIFFNWHLAKSTPAASLVCHIPCAHSTCPRAKGSLLLCTTSALFQKGFVHGVMTTGTITSSCRVYKHHQDKLLLEVLGFASWRCLCFLLAKTSTGPQCGKRARREQVLQLLWQRDCLWCLQFLLSVFIFFLLLLLPVIIYYFLIEYFVLWFSQNRCSQQYLFSLAWHKCLRRLTAGPHICCNI